MFFANSSFYEAYDAFSGKFFILHGLCAFHQRHCLKSKTPVGHGRFFQEELGSLLW
jgi:hypothetical protein